MGLKKSLLLLIIILLVIPLVTASPENELLNLINKERNSNNLSSLKPLLSLTTAAVFHTTDMIEKGYLEHVTKNNKTLTQRVREVGYKGNFIGENIGAHTGKINASRIFKLWKESPSHYKKILNPNYTDIGIGIKNGKYPHFKNRTSSVYTIELGGKKHKEKTFLEKFKIFLKSLIPTPSS